MKSKAFVVMSIGVTLLALLWVASGVVAGSPQQGAENTSNMALANGGPGYFTIPAAAFRPYQDGYNFENHGRYLIHQGGPEGWYLAPVHLPQGATVTKMTFHWYNNYPAFQASAKLHRTEFGVGDYLEMAYADTSLGGTGYGSSYDDTIAYATIDNSKYAYWVFWDLPATPDVMGCGMVIEYSYPVYLSTVLKNYRQ